MVGGSNRVPIPGLIPEEYPDLEEWARNLNDNKNTSVFVILDCSREIYRSCELNKDVVVELKQYPEYQLEKENES